MGVRQLLPAYISNIWMRVSITARWHAGVFLLSLSRKYLLSFLWSGS
jgi:hypothetical protein